MISGFGLFFDDSFDLGFGHVSRLVALAQELRQRNLDYCFHSNGEMKRSSQEFIANCGLRSSCKCNQEVEIGILDTYNPEFIKDFSLSRIRVLMIDETSPSLFADAYLVASPILSWTPPTKDSKVLAFQNSPILRQEIVVGARDSSRTDTRNGILVVLGGVSIEIFRKIICELKSAAQDIWPESPLSVVCYSPDQISIAQSLNFEIVHPLTDFLELTSRFLGVISAAGVIAWELAALGIPGFTIAVVPNQEFQVQHLRDNNIRDGISASSLNFKELFWIEIAKMKGNNAEQKIRPGLDGSRKAIDFVLHEFSP